ncbi:putative secreted effector protein [Blumeria graminis f. sp. tritici 96224]|uniref:Putative secreted effector protein n=2 Tax=Blumeria graminis f. sp. tritici 96224 TaxID=1268274 RepID=A0A656KG04_BLUGR|nr:putative secreted effector protein [Blumeria graminis f. sp. tritici 96224]
MRFLLAFALMVIGLMALPIGPNVDRRSSNKTIGTKILENLDGFRFEDKFISGSSVNLTLCTGTIENAMEKVSTIIPVPVEKKAGSGRKMSTLSKLFGPAIGQFSHSNKTKRFLQQDPPGYQLDGKLYFSLL